MKDDKYKTDLDAIFECSPQILCLLNERAQFVKANKFLINTLGYHEDELLLRYFIDFVHPQDQERATKQFNTLFQHKSIKLFETRFRCANGLYKNFAWNIGVLPNLTFYTSGAEITDCSHIQSQLTKALTDNQNIYDNSLDVLCMLDAEGRFARVSKSSKSLWGYNEKELLGEKCLDFVYSDDVALTIAIDLEIRSGKNVTNFGNRFLHKNRSIVPIIWSAYYLPFEQMIFATAHDASLILEQNEKLYLNQRRFEVLLRSGKDIICIIGADGTYQYVSPSVKQALHFEPDFYLGKKPFEFIHPDDVSRIAKTFEYVLTTDEHVHVAPFRFIDAYGNWCWLDSFVTNKINDPAILGVVINARDISIQVKDEQEKQMALENLRLSNERYELVAKATKDVIWDWDLGNNQLSRGKGFEKLLGFSSYDEALLSHQWDQYIYPDDKEPVLMSIIAATSNPNEMFWQSEYRYIRHDGSVAFITDQGYIVRDADKKAIRMVGAMHDNTEVKEKELRIYEQQEQLHEIAKINSHIIRRPVAMILGLMELLDKESIVGEDNREILEHLLSSTKELDDVIRQINAKTLD